MEINSRTTKVMKNSLVSFVVQILIILLGFVNRKVFVMYLDIELLGYNNLFANIFQLLNVTELGMGGIITFHLYKAFAENDEKEITKLMYLYRYVYRVIGLIVLVLGSAIYFFLPYIIKGENYDWHFIHVIYLIQLAGTVSGYFLSYMRTMFTTDQMEYKIIGADFVSKLLTCILQIAIIIILKNYIVYLVIATTTTILANVFITIATYRHYKYLHNKVKVTRDDVSRWNIVKDVKNLMIQKVVGYFNGGADNIIISMFCGIKNVALYGNYVLIQSNINNIFLYRLLNPIQASIGNYVYSDIAEEQQKRTFFMLDMFCVWIASFEMAGFFLFYQPFISLWLGSEFLLAEPFVITFAFSSYLCLSNEMVFKYRCTIGEYDKDRNWMCLAAIINISLSVVLCKFLGAIDPQLGMFGVQLGTVFSYFPIFWGRIKLVIEGMFKLSNGAYVWDHVKSGILEVVECVIMYFGAKYVGKGALNIVFRVFLFISVPLLFNWLYYRKRQDYKDMVIYIKKVFVIAKNKILHRNEVN